MNAYFVTRGHLTSISVGRRTINRPRVDSLMLCQTALSTGSVVTHLSVLGMTIVKGR